MPDIKIKGWSGNEFEYKDVPKIWLPAPESTEEVPVLVPYTYGEAVSKTVELDFSAGDMAVPIADGELVKELTITKPETLTPENIAAGINIAGILGAFAGGGGILASGGTYQPDTTGRVTVSHCLGVVPDFVIVCGNASTGFFYQYSMSDAFHIIAESDFYLFAALTNGNSITGTSEMITNSAQANIFGIIGHATTDSFQVGGGISCLHELGKTYTWFAFALQ